MAWARGCEDAGSSETPLRLEKRATSRKPASTSTCRDSDRFSNRFGVSLEPSAATAAAPAVMSFLAMDPPRHTRMRALVARGFTPRRVADLEPGVRSPATRYIDGFIARGRCDFIADLAARLPMDVISEMLGVPAGARDRLRGWADTVVHREEGMLDVPPAGMEAAAYLLAYLGELVDARRRQPREDLVSALLAAQVDGDRLTQEDVLGFLFLMIIAGNETTTKLLGNALYWLWQNPRQRQLVGGDPGLATRWVEETLRYDGSTQALVRTVALDLELHGHRLAAGDKVVLLVGSANRDERVFPDPDAYDIMRDTSAMLSFGHGTHFCMGAALARLEARVVLEEVLARLPDYEIDAGSLVRVHSINVRGFASLPIEFSS